ncbi:MAG TPA: hypothetical protein VMT27_01330 [Actinomycetes bacterium]|nr:hypothetical protein [Actinomycetes bacterium]
MAEDQRTLAVRMFNATWDLIETRDRSAEQDRQMLLMACASRQLWDGIGGPMEKSTGDWQVGHVAALLGHASLSLDFANAAYEQAISGEVPAWMIASTSEGLARAHAAAGHALERDAWIQRTRQLLQAVEDDEDRSLVETQLSTVPSVG